MANRLRWTLVAAFVCANVGQAFGQPLSTEVERALVSENWERAIALLGADNSETTPVVSRLAKAHAYLATNRNNESLCLFLSAKTEAELAEWEKWTVGFRSRNPDSEIAQYLMGDALAREKRWDDALKALASAKDPLSLNARGAVYAQIGKLDLAYRDFSSAANAAPGFADAHASWGALNIQQKDGAEGALREYSRAIELSPQFGLAYNGRACAHVALGDPEGATKDFETGVNSLSCGKALVRQNIAATLDYFNGAKTGVPAKMSHDDVGTALLSQFNDMKANPSGWNVNRFVSTLRGLPDATQSQYINMTADYAKSNPQWAAKIKDAAGAGVLTNKQGGWADNLGRLMTDVTSITIGKVGFGLANSGAGRMNVTEGNEKVFTSLYTKLPDAQHDRIGGVTSDVSRLHLDAGDWPFTAFYGLAYGIDTVPPGARRENEDRKK